MLFPQLIDNNDWDFKFKNQTVTLKGQSANKIDLK